VHTLKRTQSTSITNSNNWTFIRKATGVDIKYKFTVWAKCRTFMLTLAVNIITTKLWRIQEWSVFPLSYLTKEKANVFAAYLADVFRAGRGHIYDDVAEFITAPWQMSLPIRAYTIAEVNAEITRLNTCKAPGYDLITTQILKHLPYKTTALLTLLFNRILTLSYFPVLWKYAEIIMIPKPCKPPHEPTSYRPICIFTYNQQLFEWLFLKRISKEHDLSTLLPSHQFGFCERHSTIHQVHRIVNL
jgi:hypothetical protein